MYSPHYPPLTPPCKGGGQTSKLDSKLETRDPRLIPHNPTLAMKIRNTEHRESTTLQMTPMIDIVFQLLVFFVFTFKIVLPEGDFNIRMPSSSASQTSTPSETPLLRVRLRAAPSGELAQVKLGDKVFEANTNSKKFGDLQDDIRALIDDGGGPGSTDQEVEIEADYDLKYRYAMNAITAITGEVDPNGEQHKLVERVRFAPLEDQ